MLDEKNEILYVDNKRIHLSPWECNLLSFFVENKEKILTANEIIDYSNIDEIYTYIYRLNKKIFPYFKIQNYYRFGYKIKTL